MKTYCMLVDVKLKIFVRAEDENGAKYVVCEKSKEQLAEPGLNEEFELVESQEPYVDFIEDEDPGVEQLKTCSTCLDWGGHDLPDPDNAVAYCPVTKGVWGAREGCTRHTPLK